MTIFLIGDSTLQYNDETTYPQVGWGQVFSEFINKDIKVVNLGKNGASTKSFINGPRLTTLKDNISKGDLLLIQFGHNDEGSNPVCHTSPFTDYIDNLLYLVNIARKVGATPILLSSIARRAFVNHKIVDTHKEYVKAMKLLADKENILFIDINKLMMNELDKIGEEESKKYFMVFDKGIYKNYINGLNDNTHIREDGARLVCEILIKELRKYFDLKD